MLYSKERATAQERPCKAAQGGPYHQPCQVGIGSNSKRCYHTQANANHFKPTAQNQRDKSDPLPCQSLRGIWQHTRFIDLLSVQDQQHVYGLYMTEDAAADRVQQGQQISLRAIVSRQAHVQ